jgi:large subunit ribosomal protein L20
MPRVKRGFVRRAKRRRLLDRAKGFFQTKSKLYRAAKEAVDKSLKCAYAGRKLRKRDFRKLRSIASMPPRGTASPTAS